MLRFAARVPLTCPSKWARSGGQLCHWCRTRQVCCASCSNGPGVGTIEPREGVSQGVTPIQADTVGVACGCCAGGGLPSHQHRVGEGGLRGRDPLRRPAAPAAGHECQHHLLLRQDAVPDDVQPPGARSFRPTMQTRPSPVCVCTASPMRPQSLSCVSDFMVA